MSLSMDALKPNVLLTLVILNAFAVLATGQSLEAFGVYAGLARGGELKMDLSKIKRLSVVMHLITCL